MKSKRIEELQKIKKQIYEEPFNKVCLGMITEVNDGNNELLKKGMNINSLLFSIQARIEERKQAEKEFRELIDDLGHDDLIEKEELKNQIGGKGE